MDLPIPFPFLFLFQLLTSAGSRGLAGESPRQRKFFLQFIYLRCSEQLEMLLWPRGCCSQPCPKSQILHPGFAALDNKSGRFWPHFGADLQPKAKVLEEIRWGWKDIAGNWLPGASDPGKLLWVTPAQSSQLRQRHQPQIPGRF